MAGAEPGGILYEGVGVKCGLVASVSEMLERGLT